MVFTFDDKDWWRPLLMIALYYQTKTSINSLIQLSEILPVELIGTYKWLFDLNHSFMAKAFYFIRYI